LAQQSYPGNGLSVLVKGRRGFDARSWVTALEDALEGARAVLEAEQGGEAGVDTSTVQEAA
jgi:hypothetical protein